MVCEESGTFVTSVPSQPAEGASVHSLGPHPSPPCPIAVQALCGKVEALRGRLEEQKEWCVEQGCCGGREATAVSAWRWISRLLGCVQELTARSKQRIAEWSEITNSVSRKSLSRQRDYFECIF